MSEGSLWRRYVSQLLYLLRNRCISDLSCRVSGKMKKNHYYYFSRQPQPATCPSKKSSSVIQSLISLTAFSQEQLPLSHVTCEFQFASRPELRTINCQFPHYCKDQRSTLLLFSPIPHFITLSSHLLDSSLVWMGWSLSEWNGPACAPYKETNSSRAPE